MILTLMRHAQVDSAYLNCYNGHKDIGLSETGRRQAETLARRFEGENFDAVYSSDLRRCTETLAPFGQAGGAVTTPLLREKSWGRHEGMTFETIAEQEGIRYENFLQWINALDGEPSDAYVGRVRRFFLETLPSQPYEHVFIMTHAGVIRVLMHLLRRITLEEAFAVPFPYGAYTTLDLDTRTFGETVCAA